ncbi:MAG: hypothetical protein CL537_03865 [Alcanivoracaceae bacterium]|nr:hypothetical protein [Alcanivoracaceae bacterium]|tara:strand:+ start:4975 stop:5511 length:537 start_codon:yes stop_codon:yes gene_type:complete
MPAITDVDVIGIVRSLPAPDDKFNDYEFFMRGQILLEKELKKYLDGNGVACSNRSFYELILEARKFSKRNRRLWDAMDTFRTVRNKYAHAEMPEKKTRRAWIKFVNIIESIFGYEGAKLFPIKNIKKKRVVRLYFSVLVSIEYLRGLCGEPLKQSPFEAFLDVYMAELNKRMRNRGHA